MLQLTQNNIKPLILPGCRNPELRTVASFRHNTKGLVGVSLPETPAVAVLFRPTFGFFRDIIFDQILKAGHGFIKG